ncbi:MAG TPA: PQQ-binding-like beta-propeller repeat protein, partial [Chroococcidiopsis sp.]
MKTMLRDRRLRFVILTLLALGCVIIPFALQVEQRLFVLDAHQGTLLHSISLPNSAQKSVQTKVIAGDRLFVETTTQRADHRFDWELALIDIRSGQQQWRFTSPLTPSRLWDAAVPVYVGEKTVYVSLDNGQAHDQLYAIDIATGQPRWHIERAWKDPDAEYSFSRFDLHNSGRIGAVEVGDRLVLLTPNDEGQVFLQTLDQATGTLIRQSDISDWAIVNPIGGVNYALLQGDRTLTLWRDHSDVHTYDLASGKSRFTVAGEW